MRPSTNSAFIFRVFLLSGVVFSSALFSGSLFAETTYVSDELTIPVRTGASNQHRIIKFLSSGTRLNIIEESDDAKYVHVELGNDKTGWVLKDKLMSIPSGRDRLVTANKKLTQAREQVKELKASVSELKSELKSLKGEKNSLLNERTNLSNSLEDLKITAANPLSLAKKNKALKRQLDQAHDNEASLERENQQLRSNVTQEWFMIGGSVSIGSLILGLLITRINWRRKRSNWGDSF